MPIAAALIIAGGSLISGSLGAGAASSAAETQSEAALAAAEMQQQAAQQALEEQRRQFELQWGAGEASRNALNRLAGILSGDIEYDVTQEPGYQERLAQGLQTVTSAQAARGGRFGGRALKELTRYGQTFAGNERQNYLNRLAQVAGLSTTPASPNTAGTIMAGAQAGAQGILGAGQAGAQGIMGAAQSWNNAIQGGMGNWLAYQNQQNLTNALNPAPATMPMPTAPAGTAGASMWGYG